MVAIQDSPDCRRLHPVVECRVDGDLHTGPAVLMLSGNDPHAVDKAWIGPAAMGCQREEQQEFQESGEGTLADTTEIIRRDTECPHSLPGSCASSDAASCRSRHRRTHRPDGEQRGHTNALQLARAGTAGTRLPSTCTCPSPFPIGRWPAWPARNSSVREARSADFPPSLLPARSRSRPRSRATGRRKARRGSPPAPPG